MKSRPLILALSFLMWLYSQIAICAKPESFVQTGHTSYVKTIAFSPDGKFIISGGGDKTARLWNVATGIHIVAASTKNQYSAEVKTLGHGVFTHTLLSGVQGAAAAGDQKTITVRSLLAFVEEKLPAISKEFKQEAQYPVVYSRGTDFPLTVK
jgi:hypothetical protein